MRLAVVQLLPRIPICPSAGSIQVGEWGLDAYAPARHGLDPSPPEAPIEDRWHDIPLVTCPVSQLCPVITVVKTNDLLRVDPRPVRWRGPNLLRRAVKAINSDRLPLPGRFAVRARAWESRWNCRFKETVRSRLLR